MKVFKKIKRALLCGVAALLVPGVVAAVPSSAVLAQDTEAGSETFTENDQTSVNVIETTAAGEEVKTDGGYNKTAENTGNTVDFTTGSNNEKDDIAVDNDNDNIEKSTGNTAEKTAEEKAGNDAEKTVDNNADNFVNSDAEDNTEKSDNTEDNDSAVIGKKQDDDTAEKKDESVNKGTNEETTTSLKTETVKRSGVGAVQTTADPVVKKITFDKKEYKPGDTVTVTIDVTDPGGINSGFINWGAGSYDRAGRITVADSDGNEKRFELRLIDDKIITGIIKITDAWKNGSYRVTDIYFCDESRNYVDPSIETDAGIFSITGSKEDNKGPVVNAVYFDKTNVKPGDVITVTADVADQTGTEYVYIEMTSEGKDIMHGYDRGVRLHKKADGSFKGTIKIDDGWLNGKYYLSYVRAADVNGNESTATSSYSSWIEDWHDLSKIQYKKIIVSGSNEDSSGPLVTSLKFDKSTVKHGDTVKVTAEATKAVKEIIVSLVNENDIEDYFFSERGGTISLERKEIVLVPDANGRITGEFIIDEGWKKGKYTVEFVEAYDIWGYESGLWGGQNISYDEWNKKKELYGISLNVQSSKADSKGPAVKSVTVDKDTLRPGEEITVVITLEDDSGVDPYVPRFSIATKDLYTWTLSGYSDLIAGNKVLFRLRVDKSAKPGTYSLSELILKDLVGNVSYFASSLIKNSDWESYYHNMKKYGVDNEISLDQKDIIKIRILDTTGEFNGPEIKSLKLDKTKVKQFTDTVTFTATLEDSSDIDHVKVVISKDTHAMANGRSVELRKQADGSIKGEVTPDGSWGPGIYYVSGLYAVDKNGERSQVGVNSDGINVEDVIIGSDRFEVIRNDMNITLDKKLLVLDKGKSGMLTATVTPADAKDKTVTWSSSNTSVATVDKDGNVTAVNHGTAKITAKTSNGKSAECEVRVNFIDVTNAKEWYYKPVYWAAEKGITTGTDGKFFPADSCTREQSVTFLWRMAGRPEPKNMNSPYSDVKDKNRYSYKAIMWGTEKGVITGTDGKFYPTGTCTREQIVTMIWRLAGKPEPKNMNSKFKDVTSKTRYSYKAVMWAAEKGITTGTNGLFYPTGQCKRREIVTFIYRYKN